jgi:hypothetical protein
MMGIRNLFTLVFMALLLAPAAAQVDLSPHFEQQLSRMQLEFLEPVEAGYKDVRVVQNEFFDYDFAIRSRRERLEIRFAIAPFQPGDQAVNVPHVRAMRLVSHLATNEGESIISALSIDEAELREQFNADWGKVFFFTPKEKFTSYGPELDYRFYALRFLGPPN